MEYQIKLFSKNYFRTIILLTLTIVTLFLFVFSNNLNLKILYGLIFITFYHTLYDILLFFIILKNGKKEATILLDDRIISYRIFQEFNYFILTLFVSLLIEKYFIITFILSYFLKFTAIEDELFYFFLKIKTPKKWTWLRWSLYYNIKKIIFLLIKRKKINSIDLDLTNLENKLQVIFSVIIILIIVIVIL